VTPNDIKTACVKNGKADVGNYRSISVLSTVSKNIKVLSMTS